MIVDLLVIKQKVMAAAVNVNQLPQPSAGQDRIADVMSIVFTITGAIALLMVTIGGMRYVLSHGDPSATAQAKNTILYALIGLVVSIIAVALVTFVIKRVG